VGTHVCYDQVDGTIFSPDGGVVRTRPDLRVGGKLERIPINNDQESLQGLVLRLSDLEKSGVGIQHTTSGGLVGMEGI
jgi:hypothetical protein